MTMLASAGSGLGWMPGLAATVLAGGLGLAGTLGLMGSAGPRDAAADSAALSLDERLFLAAGDELRTHIAQFWWEQSQAGHPRLPVTLSELASLGIPSDPWTGSRAWGVVRDASGGITAVYSLSGHRVAHPQALAVLAEPRRGLDGSAREALGASAWQFGWEPPAAHSARDRALMPRAVDALRGDWPQLPGASSSRLVLDRSPVASVMAPKPARRMHASAQAAAPGAAVPVPPPRQRPATPADFSVFVPILPVAEGAGASAPVQLAAAEGASGAADAEAAAPANTEPAQPAPFEFSTDLRVRRCQTGLGVATAADGVCRDARQQDDAGLAWDACMRDLEIRVAQCASQR